MKREAGPWEFLKKFTHARIALGRVGHSVPTRELLDFRMAHSRAKDSVWGEIDFSKFEKKIEFSEKRILKVESLCKTKKEFLLHPHRGRDLDLVSLEAVKELGRQLEPSDCCLILADGLSAFALQKNGAIFANALISELENRKIKLGAVILAKYARVALGDGIGEKLKARSVVTLLGERPGLASPESLSVYFTYQPVAGKTDAERNCISNIHSEGLAPGGAAQMTAYLVEQSLKKQLSGVGLKVEYPALNPQLQKP